MGSEDEFDIDIQDAMFDIDDGENGDMENNMEVSRSCTYQDDDARQYMQQSIEEHDRCDKNQYLDDESNTEGEPELPYQDQEIERPVNVDDRKNSIVDNRETERLSGSSCAKEDSTYFGTEEDPEMDDDFDAILTQIDEKLMSTPCENSSSAKTNMSSDVNCNAVSNSSTSPDVNMLVPEKSPAKRDYNLETSSFFMSQDSPTDLIPLKRTFPGPAGLLPELNSEEIKLLDSAPHPLCQKVSRIVSETSKTRKTKQKYRRGNPPGFFGRKLTLSKAPWRSLLGALGLNLKDENSLVNLLNIRWVRTKLMRFPETVNVSFLVAVVRDEMEILPSNVKACSCKLMDPSGTIVAAVDPGFVEAFSTKIMPGTAIALRNCGVSKFGSQILLTICKRNLLYLVTEKNLDDEEEETIPTGQEFPLYKKENGLFIVQMAKFNQEKILEEYESILTEMKFAYEDQSEIQTESAVNHSVWPQQQQLFTAVSTTTRQFVDTSNTTGNSTFSGSNISNFNLDSSGFDDDDDDELMQALENVNFLIDEESL